MGTGKCGSGGSVIAGPFAFKTEKEQAVSETETNKGRSAERSEA